MDRPESFSHMIACEEICDTGQLVEELIFKAKERCGPDDRCFRVELASYEFRLALDCVSFQLMYDWRKK